MTPKNATMAAGEAVRLDLVTGCGCSGASSRSAGGTEGGCGSCGGCGGGCGGSCGSEVAERERPRWFAGQLVGPRDLTDAQSWMLERMRRHNRLLHGWGVDCGLIVKLALDSSGRPVPWTVQIGTGYALAPSGDEILVDCPATVDVRAGQEAGSGSTPLDPWCAPVRQRRDPAAVYYLAVRYDEAMTRPVRSASCGCGCDDDTACEYSRIHEGYAFALLDELPEHYGNAGGDSEALLQEAVSCSSSIRQHGSRGCPGCACSPWVVLADVTVSAQGAVTIDQLAHRRFVASFGSYGFSCAPRSLGCMEVVAINRIGDGPESALVDAFMNGDTSAVDKLVGIGNGVLGTVALTADGPDPAGLSAVTSSVSDIVVNRLAEEAVLWLAESWSERGGDGEAAANAAVTTILDGAGFIGTRQEDEVRGFSGACGARLFVVSIPKPPPPVLGCVEVVAIIQGLELTDEAHLWEAYTYGPMSQMDDLIRRGVGAMGSVNYRVNGPDQAGFDDSVTRLKNHVAVYAPWSGPVLWVDQDWAGRGGPAQAGAEAAAKQVLAAAGIPAADPLPVQVKDYSGGCGARLIVMTMAPQLN